VLDLFPGCEACVTPLSWVHANHRIVDKFESHAFYKKIVKRTKVQVKHGMLGLLKASVATSKHYTGKRTQLWYAVVVTRMPEFEAHIIIFMSNHARAV
jgi:hypothetical protein